MSQRKFTPKQKAAIALAALKGDKTIAQISSIYQVHETQIRNWKKIVEDNFAILFENPHRQELGEQQRLIDELYRIIGKRDTELDWLKKKLHIIDA